MSENQKTFLGKVVEGIAHGIHWLTKPFAELFDKVEKAYESLDVSAQQYLKKASAIVAVVTQFESLTPAFVYEAINKMIPGVTKEEIDKLLNGLASKLNIAASLPGADISTTLTNIQAYLNTFQGAGWVNITNTAVGFILSELTPDGTLMSKLLLCVQFVYHNFIAKDVAQLKAATTVAAV